LEGPLPAFLGSLPLLELNLSDNRLNGTLPDWIFNISRVKLQDNLFSGSLPQVPFDPTTQRNFWFSVYRNNLSGDIPPAVGQYTWVNLATNHFSGGLEHLNGTRSTNISIIHNEFSGPLPSFFRDVTIIVKDNNFSCPVVTFQVNNCVEFDDFANNYFCDDSGITCETLGSLNCSEMCRGFVPNSPKAPISVNITFPQGTIIDKPTVIQGDLNIVTPTTILIPTDFGKDDTILTVTGCLTLQSELIVTTPPSVTRPSTIDLIKANCIIGDIDNIKTTSDEQCFNDKALRTNLGITLNVGGNTCYGHHVTRFSFFVFILVIFFTLC